MWITWSIVTFGLHFLSCHIFLSKYWVDWTWPSCLCLSLCWLILFLYSFWIKNVFFFCLMMSMENEVFQSFYRRFYVGSGYKNIYFASFLLYSFRNTLFYNPRRCISSLLVMVRFLGYAIAIHRALFRQLLYWNSGDPPQKSVS
jgi:hypothetical protein